MGVSGGKGRFEDEEYQKMRKGSAEGGISKEAKEAKEYKEAREGVHKRKGNGGMEKVVMKHSSGAYAEVYLWGATLTRYRTASGKEVIFTSPGAIFDRQKAIRGGIPLVFPQFGRPDEAMPQHGLARTALWSLDKKDVVEGGDLEAVFGLEIKATDAWPHSCRLEYKVRLGLKGLSVELKTQAPTDKPLKFQALLHTYLNVSDIGKVNIEGLHGLNYTDKVPGKPERGEENDDVLELPERTDRIYEAKNPYKNLKVTDGDDSTIDINVMISVQGGTRGVKYPADIVVWNPYPEASPDDLPLPHYKNFVCVEPGLVRKQYEIPPEATIKIAQTLQAD